MGKYKLSDIFENNYLVSQTYGNNVSYYRQFGLEGHEGVDYALPIGVNLLCPFEEGVVIRDNDDFKNNTYGNFFVVWDKSQKCAVWFCHCSENNVSIGQVFKRGQVMGKSGNSGNSSGPHLHMNFVETDQDGNRLNTNNGRQGFLNILDPQLVEWIPINSSINLNTPMEDNIKRKSYFLDLLAKVKYGDNFNTDSLTQDQVTSWINEYKSERKRAAEWEKLAKKAGYDGATDELTFQMLFDKLTSMTEAVNKALQEARVQYERLLAEKLVKCREEMRALMHKKIDEA